MARAKAGYVGSTLRTSVPSVNPLDTGSTGSGRLAGADKTPLSAFSGPADVDASSGAFSAVVSVSCALVTLTGGFAAVFAFEAGSVALPTTTSSVGLAFYVLLAITTFDDGLVLTFRARTADEISGSDATGVAFVTGNARLVAS
jgi:hypothetical protein